MTRRCYLLEGAQEIELSTSDSFYDVASSMNMIIRDGRKIPLVTDERFGRTGSKTFQEPSDDDPDPEDEGCY